MEPTTEDEKIKISEVLKYFGAIIDNNGNNEVDVDMIITFHVYYGQNE